VQIAKGIQVEIEAKYAVADPAVFNTLLQLEHVDGYALRPAGHRDVVDHYLDTPQRALLRGGYTCRLREGQTEGRWIVTVKRVATAVDGVHQREEHECELSARSAPTDWPQGPARDMVLTLSKGQALTELFALRQHRILRAVGQGDRAVGELSFDVVEIDVGGRRTVTREVEFELTRDGTLADLRAVGARLEGYQLDPQSTSKFERALGLLDAVVPPRPRRKGPNVRGDEPMAEAGRRVLQFHYAVMRANEKGTIDGRDIEALHRMRVATRRQRAAFRVIAPHFRRKAIRPFREALQTAAQHLGAVRDLDVLIEAAVRHQKTLGEPAARAFHAVLDAWRERRDAAQEKLVAYLTDDGYRRFADCYEGFLSTARAGVKEKEANEPPEPELVRQLLPAAIWGQYGRVRAYEGVMGWASLETLHALRIECKRLRYLLEFFAGLLGAGVTIPIKALVALQDHIGELHDAEMSIDLLREFLMTGARQGIDQQITKAATGYLKAVRTRAGRLEGQVMRPWRRVSSPRMRLLLARAAGML